MFLATDYLTQETGKTAGSIKLVLLFLSLNNKSFRYALEFPPLESLSWVREKVHRS